MPCRGNTLRKDIAAVDLSQRREREITVLGLDGAVSIRLRAHPPDARRDQLEPAPLALRKHDRLENLLLAFGVVDRRDIADPDDIGISQDIGCTVFDAAVLDHTHVAHHPRGQRRGGDGRSEEPTSELQSLMRISYAVFCLKKK